MSRVSAQELQRREQEITEGKMGRTVDRKRLEEFLERRRKSVSANRINAQNLQSSYNTYF